MADIMLSLQLKLNDYRKAILLALLWFDHLRADKLKIAVKMMMASQFDYAKLLKNAAKDLMEYKSLLNAHAQHDSRSGLDHAALGVQPPRILAETEYLPNKL